MTAKRSADFDLAAAVHDPGFTPRGRDLRALVDLVAVADEDTALAAERVALQLGGELAATALSRLDDPTADALARARMVRLMGKVAVVRGDPVLWDRVLTATKDADGRTRRYAVVALGRAEGHPGVEDALLAMWHDAPKPELRRALAATLGRVGGPRATELLRGVRSDDAELMRLVSKALLTLDRGVHRQGVSDIDAEAVAPKPMTVIVRCRPGLEPLCLEEFDAPWAPEIVGEGCVRVTLTGALGTVFRSRVMTWFGFALPDEKIRVGEDAGTALTRVLVGEAAAAVFRTYTRGTVRYRIAWAEGGHHRAVVWRAAAAVSSARGYINDPRDSTWEASAHIAGGLLHVTLSPLRLTDPRFAYRVAEVPAASHPSLAAALVRAGGTRRSDVVWDPFVGSGLELVERAKLGDWVRMVGTDTDPRAVEAALANVRAAGVEGVEVYRRDAFDGAPEGVSLVLTNPPMGFRVGFGDDVAAMLDRFVEAVADWLKPGGRMVWLSPQGERSAATARRNGLRVVLDRPVELGGFAARMQRYDKPFARRAG